MKDTYIETVNEYLKAIKESGNFGEHIHFINKLFFGYPSLKVDIEILNTIYQNISNEFSVPFHDIKLIGSSHIGFSLVKWDCENNVVQKYRPSSDIDIAIINQELFIKMLSATFIKSQAYTDNTSFKEPNFPKQFKNNIANGYIRPDTLGDVELRKNWLRFFRELSLEFNLKISAAVYLNETFFVTKLEKALNTYKLRLEGENGNAIE